MNEHGRYRRVVSDNNHNTHMVARLYLPTLPTGLKIGHAMWTEKTPMRSASTAPTQNALSRSQADFVSTHGPICRFLSQPPQEKKQGWLR
jgi:hypothetical protein